MRESLSDDFTGKLLCIENLSLILPFLRPKNKLSPKKSPSDEEQDFM
ncbi:hypothetical protein STRDD12_01560 [Streptococcus sp. DD12]|nr:hypothetical protein STRDD12_01560 [Streptococcus sp. DD12]